MKRFILPTLLLATTALGLAADPQSPFLGTWKYNANKSHVSSGSLPNPNSVVKIEQDRGALLWTNGGASDGKSSKFTYRFKFDGQDYPVTGSSLYDTMAVREIDHYSGKPSARKTERYTAQPNGPYLKMERH